MAESRRKPEQNADCVMLKDEISAKLIEINSAKELPKNAKLPILKQQVSNAKAKKDLVVKPVKENEPVTKPLKYVLTNKKRGFENSTIETASQQDQTQLPDDGSTGSGLTTTGQSAASMTEARKKSRKNSTFLDNFNIIDVVPSDYLCQEETESQVTDHLVVLIYRRPASVIRLCIL